MDSYYAPDYSSIHRVRSFAVQPLSSSTRSRPVIEPAHASGSGSGSGSGASGTATGVVVLDSLHEDDTTTKINPEEDLWLSTVDGRYGTAPVPIRVGQFEDMETFYVHEDVLTKSGWFRTALEGNFRESSTRSFNLPEEDPSIFHFLVAFLYEGRYEPIKPASSGLDPVQEKGKGKSKEVEDTSSESDSSVASWASRSSERSRLAQERRRRRRERDLEQRTRLREKHPGQHRLTCRCSRCEVVEGPRCWDCGALPSERPHQGNRRRGYFEPAPPNPRNEAEKMDEFEGRIQGEDLRTWIMAYELSIAVYICADRYLMDDFKTAVMQYTVDMLETAGTDAAQIEVLQQCARLHGSVPETDPLLRMVLSRVGFLQTLLWKSRPDETGAFLVANPEVAAAMLRETVHRHQIGSDKKGLPPMESDEQTRARRRRERQRQPRIYP